MTELRVPTVDFSSLAKLGEVYDQSKEKASWDGLSLAALGQDGKLDYDKAAAHMVKAGNIKGAVQIAQAAKAMRGDNSFYGTPIYGTRSDGSTAVGTFDKLGQFKEIQTPGFTPTPGGFKPLDLGMMYGAFDPRTGRMTGPTIGKTGDLPPSYRPTQNPSGGLSAEAIPGSPAAQKINDDAQKQTAKAAQTAVTGELVKGTIGKLRNLVTRAPFYNPAVGFGAETASKIGGTNAADAAHLIQTIVGNIGFDRLQRMREESPTGGALGQVAVQELMTLQATIGSLAQPQSERQFLDTLDQIEKIYEGIIEKASAYPNAAKHGFGGGSQASQAKPSTGNANSQSNETRVHEGRSYVKIGNQWFEQ